MTDTTTVTLAADAWTTLSTGSRDVAIQLSTGRALVHVGTTAPALGAAGIIIDRDNPTAGFANLPATDNVYARAIEGTARIVLVKS